MTKIQEHLQTINDYSDPESELFQIYYLAGLLETGQIVYDPKRELIDSHVIDNPSMRRFLSKGLKTKLDML